METPSRAGIDVYGSALRYVELERYGARYRLLRLGRCDFDFDIAQAMIDGDAAHLDTLGEALRDVLDGSGASRLHVMLHPPSCYSFFTPLPASIEPAGRERRLRQEAALLMQTEAPQPLRLTADPVYTETADGGSAVEWFHVLAVEERMQNRLDDVLRVLPHAGHRLVLSTHAAAKAVEHLERDATGGRLTNSLSLAVGCYPTHTEYALCENARWRFSRYVEDNDPADTAYFALALLDRLGLHVGAVQRVYLYGDPVDPAVEAPLEAVLRHRPRRLNPIRLVSLDAESMEAHTDIESFDVEAFVPCIGGTL